MLNIGSVLDRRYRIDYVVKQGGMGTVYGAHDLRLDRSCAVKAVPTRSDRETEQIEREARVLARLDHPHLPAIYDCFLEDGVVFVVMQMIFGDDLEAVTARKGQPGWDTIAGWALQLAETIQYLHQQTPAVIHRDIKPANIRLALHGQIYLVDFGIAKLLDGAATVTAARAASVPYAPIEQIQDDSHTNQQSDIYAFGATLYRLLTSTLPPSCIDRLVGKDLIPVTEVNPSVPDVLASLVHSCMELWGNDRPASIEQVIADLHRTRADTELVDQKEAAPPAPQPPEPEPAQPPVAVEPANNAPAESAPALPPQRPRESFMPSPEIAAQAAFTNGQDALGRGDVGAARRHFTRALQQMRSFPEAYAGRALAHAQQGHYDAAIADWNMALAQQRENPDWYLQRAAVHRQRQDIAAALEDLSTAIQLNPELADAYYERALLRREMGDDRGYLQDLDRVLQITPAHRPARMARVQARIEHKLWQAALPDCATLIQTNPRDVEAYLLRASVYTHRGYDGDTTLALRDIGSALAIDPNSAEAYFRRGRIHQRAGDRQAALRDFNLAIDCAPDHLAARHRRAQLYRILGVEREALAEYRILCRLLRARTEQRGSTDPAQTRRQRSMVPVVREIQWLMHARGIEQARKYLHAHCAAFREDSEDDLEERATLFECVGQFDAALDDMERLVKLLLNRQRSPATQLV